MYKDHLGFKHIKLLSIVSMLKYLIFNVTKLQCALGIQFIE